MGALGVGLRPLGSWTLRELVQETGYQSLLEDGRLELGDNGWVTLRDDLGEVLFDGVVGTSADLARVAAAVDQLMPEGDRRLERVGVDLQTDLYVRRMEFTRCAHRANNRVWHGFPMVSGIAPRFGTGLSFELPLVALPPGRGEIVSIGRTHPGLSEAMRFFQRSDGSVLVPVHPQEMVARGFSEPTVALAGTRATSSERTVLPGAPELQGVALKLDLAHVYHSGVFRPVYVNWGFEAIAKTEWLMSWVDRYSKQDVGEGVVDPFAFLPEGVAVLDLQANAAILVRSLTPYPPLPSGEATWMVPLYTLWSKDEDFPREPPLMVRLIRERPDPSVSPVDYFVEKILKPVVASEMRIALDLGASAQTHGQNTNLELALDGTPTGRIVHIDLEDLWPHPDVARAQGRPSLYDETPLILEDAAGEFWPSYGYTQHFSQALNSLLSCIDTYFPSQGKQVRARAEELIAAEVRQRAGLVNKLKDGALRFVAGYLKPRP